MERQARYCRRTQRTKGFAYTAGEEFMGRDTFQLFSSLPSVSEGLARVLDIRGAMVDHGYVLSETPSEADARAIQSDWAATSNDIRQDAEIVLGAK